VRLITAHRILIIAGIAFSVFYAVVRGRMYLAHGDTVDLVQAVAALLITGGLQWYLRSLARWDQRSRPPR
jgi:hypothetical protein